MENFLNFELKKKEKCDGEMEVMTYCFVSMAKSESELASFCLYL